MALVAQLSVAALGVLFATWAVIETVASRRARSVVALVALVAIGVAFTYRAAEAMAIVQQPLQGLYDWFIRSIVDSLPGTDSTQ